MFKKIYIEITNNCNLDCSFCNKNNRVKEFISLERFPKLLNKINGYTKYLYFHVMGEPLLHPEINELINIASSNFYINITTNGYLIDKIKDNPNIRQINISLHSFDKKYHKSLDEYLNNIFDTVDKLVLNNTYVSYRLWVNSPYKDEIIAKLNNKYQTNINKDKLTLSKNIYFEIEKEFIWPSYDNDYYEETGSCRGLRDHLGILVDGTIVPCCLDSNGLINLGNIYNDELSAIINSRLFKEMKQGFLNNKKVHELCKKCNFYNLRR